MQHFIVFVLSIGNSSTTATIIEKKKKTHLQRTPCLKPNLQIPASGRELGFHSSLLETYSSSRSRRIKLIFHDEARP